MRIDEMNFAAKSAAAQVFKDRAARRRVARAAADHGHGSRRKQLRETVGRHFGSGVRCCGPMLAVNGAKSTEPYCLGGRDETPVFKFAPDYGRSARPVYVSRRSAMLTCDLVCDL